MEKEDTYLLNNMRTGTTDNEPVLTDIGGMLTNRAYNPTAFLPGTIDIGTGTPHNRRKSIHPARNTSNIQGMLVNNGLWLPDNGQMSIALSAKAIHIPGGTFPITRMLNAFRHKANTMRQESGSIALMLTSIQRKANSTGQVLINKPKPLRNFHGQSPTLRLNLSAGRRIITTYTETNLNHGVIHFYFLIFNFYFIMSKAIIDFSRLNEAELEQQAENILAKMTGNELFPTPDPTLTVLEADLDAYRTAVADAALGDRHRVVIRNQKRAQLEWTMRALGLYVDRTAQRNEATILSAGYAVPKEPDTTQPCPKAAGVSVQPGEIGSGVAKVRVNRHRSVRMYRFEYRKLGTDTWEWVQRSRSRVQLNGLESFQQYEFRAVYIGTDPTLTYSDVVTSYVL